MLELVILYFVRLVSRCVLAVACSSTRDIVIVINIFRLSETRKISMHLIPKKRYVWTKYFR